MKNISVPLIVAAIALCAAGFFGGMKFEDYQLSKTRGSAMRQFPGTGGARGGAGGRQITGNIVSVDDTSLTVKLPDGSSKIVILSDITTINKAAEATKSDLKTGDKVAVFGTNNADGSVTAQNIQLNPVMRGDSGSPAPKP
jgi:hypothetical protein